LRHAGRVVQGQGGLDAVPCQRMVIRNEDAHDVPHPASFAGRSVHLDRTASGETNEPVDLDRTVAQAMRTLRRCPRRSARRSSSDRPPQTPASWAVSSDHWRHSSRTGQSAQIALADCTWASAGPVVPTGKNNSGSTSRQRARWRQSIDILTFRCKPWGKGKSGVSLGQESGLGKDQILARAVETPSFAAHAQGWLHRLHTPSDRRETPEPMVAGDLVRLCNENG